MNEDDKEPDFNGPITTELLEYIAKKNAEKLEEAKKYLGSKWILHKENSIKRKTQKKESNEKD